MPSISPVEFFDSEMWLGPDRRTVWVSIFCAVCWRIRVSCVPTLQELPALFALQVILKGFGVESAPRHPLLLGQRLHARE